MAKYRKKPIIVDAEVYKRGMEDGFDDDPSGLGKQIGGWPDENPENFVIEIPYIQTLEGKHYISLGDYIITGVKGERYPCKPDIFEMTYEKVPESLFR